MNSGNAEIGGIPFGILAIKRFLPLDKKGRVDALRPLTLVLTFVCYALFCAARRPITVVQLKILKECNASIFENSSINVPQGNDSWCKGTIFQNDSQTFMQVLGSLFIGAYGVCMYGSGVIADYFNPRYYLTWGSFMGSFFMVVLGLGNLWKINSIEFFIMALILFGAAQTTAWPVLLSTATHWYGGKRSGFFFALWNTHFYVGSLLGLLLAGINVQERWGFAFFFPAVLVALMGFVIFFFLVAHPADITRLDRQDISKNQEEDQIYSCDETGLYWRALPTKSLAAENEAVTYHVTILECANASGSHGVKLTLVGKCKKTRCFKNINKTALPVHYMHQESARMNSILFSEWFHGCSVPEVKKNRKKLKLKKAILTSLAYSCPRT
ncbi:Glucose-6-phosphate exchanger SLC37A2 [Araneus ventricosus]|uniref:Glucose-6-phosphate exchanger SLC37A2 n=1 Tax=Araneus ventricosus TaxID=182803 RepID=A0A4Y2IBE7_ARAVE|nr:Glucose-6-phosphate exchanger SLC37A2 [Araneus ventricosus]